MEIRRSRMFDQKVRIRMLEGRALAHHFVINILRMEDAAGSFAGELSSFVYNFSGLVGESKDYVYLGIGSGLFDRGVQRFSKIRRQVFQLPMAWSRTPCSSSPMFLLRNSLRSAIKARISGFGRSSFRRERKKSEESNSDLFTGFNNLTH